MTTYIRFYPPGLGMGAAATKPGLKMGSVFYIYLADVRPLSELCLTQGGELCLSLSPSDIFRSCKSVKIKIKKVWVYSHLVWWVALLWPISSFGSISGHLFLQNHQYFIRIMSLSVCYLPDSVQSHTLRTELLPPCLYCLCLIYTRIDGSQRWHSFGV